MSINVQRRHRRRRRRGRAKEPPQPSPWPQAADVRICTLRVLLRSKRKAHKEACRALGFASPLPRPRSLLCALHTSTRAQSTLVTHAPCVRRTMRARLASHAHAHTRLHVTSVCHALPTLHRTQRHDDNDRDENEDERDDEERDEQDERDEARDERVRVRAP